MPGYSAELLTVNPFTDPRSQPLAIGETVPHPSRYVPARPEPTAEEEYQRIRAELDACTDETPEEVVRNLEQQLADWDIPYGCGGYDDR